MTSVRDQVMERTRMSRIRNGQLVGDPVTIPSMPDVRGMLVPLTEADVIAGIARACAVDAPDNPVGMNLWDRTVRASDVYHALREPDDLTQKVFHTVEEMVEALDPSDIDAIAEQLVVLMQYASPSLADMSDEEVEAVKELWQRIDMRELTGRPAAALVLLISALMPGSPLVR